MVVVTAILWVFTVPFDPARKAIHAVSRFFATSFYKMPLGWHQHHFGFENIDTTKPYVIIVNHCSMFDVPYLYFVKGLNFRWVAKKELAKMPLFGQMIMLHGDILVDRGTKKGALEVMNKGEMWLKRGVCIAIFPEGTRSKDDNISNFKTGAFNLAKNAGVGILPIVLSGSRQHIRKSIFYNWRHHTGMQILPPVSAEEVAATDTKELMDSLRDKMIAAKQNLDAYLDSVK
ncbi:MAG: 1-acyl-sn-glycerol-3-phosphate acyltransferase [Rikenellaceae bacterium]|nr:1-acyl-sn-glycerol-3-phosphate acyltransferase [Rikenellaceae bacterium]